MEWQATLCPDQPARVYQLILAFREVSTWLTLYRQIARRSSAIQSQRMLGSQGIAAVPTGQTSNLGTAPWARRHLLQ
jgi:hypothetical protein